MMTNSVVPMANAAAVNARTASGMARNVGIPAHTV
jgi:hypothetical protein